MRKFILALFLCVLTGCINPLGAKKTETSASRVSEAIASQQALSVERSVRAESVPPMQIRVPVYTPTTPTVRVPHSSKPTDPAPSASPPSVSDNSVTITIPPKFDSTVKAESKGDIDATGTASDKFSLLRDISTGGKLILLAVGIGALFFVITLIRKNYKSVDIALSKIDGAVAIAETKIANRINTLREKSMSATDPSENARIAAEIAHWNDERGKLKAEIENLKKKN